MQKQFCNNDQECCNRDFSCQNECCYIPVAGPPGPPGPPGPTIPPQLSGLQVQLQAAAISVADGAPVIFDTTITNSSPFITYNSITGTITITASGIYYINWWISTDGAEASTFVAFSINTSAGDSIEAASPIITGQLIGNALLSITASAINPVTLQLVNTTGQTASFGTTPVRADLTIINVSV